MMRFEEFTRSEMVSTFSPLFTESDVRKYRSWGDAVDIDNIELAESWISAVRDLVGALETLVVADDWRGYVTSLVRLGGALHAATEAGGLTDPEFCETILSILLSYRFRVGWRLGFAITQGLGFLRLTGDVPFDSVFPFPVYRVDVDAVERFLRDPLAYWGSIWGFAEQSTAAGHSSSLVRILIWIGRVLNSVGASVSVQDEGASLHVRFAVATAISILIAVQNGNSMAVDIVASESFDIRLGVLRLRYQGSTSSVQTFGVSYGCTEEPAFTCGVEDTGISLRSLEISLSQQRHGTDGWWLQFSVEELSLSVGASQCDSFCTHMAGGADFRVRLSFQVRVTESRRILFEGDGGAGGLFYPNLHLGPLALLRVRFVVTMREGCLYLAACVDFSATLGPLVATVSGLGICAELSFSGKSFDLALRPPDGLSVSVNSGPVRGGGFIAYDDALGRYSGALSLSIGDIALRAIGILDTRAPGISGYSFLIVISAEFSPIQLGFGFTLNGVGGLCGIQRSVSVSALQAGVRDGSLTPLLFARDPIGQASQLVTGLQRIFPPTNDRYVFGPMFKLGWGTPTLITADLGIVLQVPSPIVIALLGTVSTTLPKPEAAVVVLNIDIVGVLEVTEKRLSIDASLRDSRVAAFTLTGDMALRFSWGDAPDFALSVGGFNPAFRPPTGFPTLRRLSLALGSGANPRLSLAAYFALTSNSLQFGARAELYATALGFTVQGYLEFHALFIFRPFSFQFDFAAGLSLKRGNSVLAAITVTGQLKGPRPWYVKATASITVLFFDVSVNIERTFGEAATPELATPVDVWERLVPALADVRNWSATLPGGRPRGVSTAADRETPPRVRLDPMSQLAVRQKVLPLDRRITKLGEAVIGPPARFSIRAVRAGTGAGGEGGAPLATSAVNEPFAAAQYQALTDAERLSSPSFQPMAAGVEALGAAVRAGGSLRAPVQWRTLLLEPQAGDDARAARGVSARMAGKMGAVDASKDAGLRATGMERFAPPEAAEPSATLEPERWTLASTRDLGARPGTAPSAAWGTSAEAMREAPAGERGRWQVVPSWEVRR